MEVRVREKGGRGGKERRNRGGIKEEKMDGRWKGERKKRGRKKENGIGEREGKSKEGRKEKIKEEEEKGGITMTIM